MTEQSEMRDDFPSTWMIKDKASQYSVAHRENYHLNGATRSVVLIKNKRTGNWDVFHGLPFGDRWKMSRPSREDAERALLDLTRILEAQRQLIHDRTSYDRRYPVERIREWFARIRAEKEALKDWPPTKETEQQTLPTEGVA